MTKTDINTNVLTDSELENIMHLLEAAYAESGNTKIFQVIDILMHDNNQLIKQQHATNNSS